MPEIAIVTMVRDDLFFLDIWLRYYGEMFGRENCYVVNHGRGFEVSEMAKGCNIIGIPGLHHKNFDMKRWRMLNNFVMGLRSYYDYVVVGDVDELLVMDPQSGVNLREFLASSKPRRVLTPVGLEVIHRIDLEPEPITDAVLGPRLHVRPAPHYSKPCAISAGTKIARGGHFTAFDRLITPEHLYLFHLKFCDFGAYCAAMDNRNAVTAAIGVGYKDAAIGRHWFAEDRGEDRAVFEAFAELDIQEGFDFSAIRQAMHDSWTPRGETGFWQFKRPDYKTQYVLPDRFSGIF